MEEPLLPKSSRKQTTELHQFTDEDSGLNIQESEPETDFLRSIADSLSHLVSDPIHEQREHREQEEQFEEQSSEDILPSLDRGNLDNLDDIRSVLNEDQLLSCLPSQYLLNFSEVVQSAKLNQPAEILSTFNAGKPSIMIASNLFGTRIRRNQYRLVARNNQPELIGFSETKMYKAPSLTGTTEEIGIFNQTDLCIGAHGSYVINIPPGKIALAWSGNQPLIFGQGSHVIHDQNFIPITQEALKDVFSMEIQHGTYQIFRIPQGKMAKVWMGTIPYFLKSQPDPYVINDPNFRLKKPFVDVNDQYITHGTYQIFRVPPGKMAKVWFGNTANFLKSQTEPYVVNDPNFKLEQPLVSINDEYIEHGTYKIFRVPPGQIAKVWMGTIPYFLMPRSEPYVFNDATFKVERPLARLSDQYIKHGNHHILRIPEGRVAKVWFGTKPVILEANAKPYIFNDPYFRLVAKNANEGIYFEKADEEAIIHGSIKRLMPRTGGVAITYNNGKLITYGPNPEGTPIMITSPNHSFDGFLPINTQTMEFPSEKTKEIRRREGADKPEDINYEVFRTSDGLPVGVKLLVVFEISNPDVTLDKLNQDQILPHIESLVVADMGMVIQNCSSGDFLKSNQTQARPTARPQNDPSIPSAPEFYEHLQDEVKNKLHDDFAKYGIKLVRLNVETPKILDQTIAKKMSEFSLMGSEARAKEAVLDQNFNIAQQEANQKAKQLEIEQSQVNANKVAQAKADLEAAKLRAEAQKIEAIARAEGRLAEAEAEAKAQRLLLEVTRERSQLYDQSPGLLQFDLAQTQTKAQIEAMAGIKSMIISPEIAQSYYLMGLNNKNLISQFLNQDI